MPDERKPDAVKVPIAYIPKEGLDLDIALKEEFGPILESARVDKGNQGTFYFLTPFPRNGATLQFRNSSNRVGEPCYTWEGRGDGVQYGYLVEGAAEHFATFPN